MNSSNLFSIRTACPLCGTDTLETLLTRPYTDPALLTELVARYEGNLSKEDLEGASYTLLHCAPCDFVFQQYVPTDALVQKLYSYRSEDRIKESFRKRVQSKASYFLNNARLAERAIALVQKKPADIATFEYGAGWGYFSLMLKAFGMNTTALEVSVERYAHLYLLGVPSVREVGEYAGAADYGHSDQVFEHLAEPALAFSELAGTVRTSGVVFIGVPNGNNIRRALLRHPRPYFFKKVYPLEHVNCFSTRALIRAALRAGLQPISKRAMAISLVRHVRRTGSIALLYDLVKILFPFKQTTALYFIKK